MKNIINVGIFAHVDAGKTTVTENILYETNVIRSIGRVDSGNTQTDTMSLERERGISIRSAATSFTKDDIKVNIIDTPGHIDFISEVERVLHVLDCAVLVISGKEGVQTQTRVLWKALKELKVPTIIFINKLDRLGTELSGVLNEIETMLTDQILVLQDAENEATQSLSIKSKNDLSDVAEVLANYNDDLLDLILEEKEVTKDFLMECISTHTINADCYPVYLGSALMNIGVKELLDGILTHFSSYQYQGSDEMSGYVFKIDKDKRNDKVHYIRVFEGALRNRSEIYIHNKDCYVKVKNLKAIVDGEQVLVDEIKQGDIGLVYGFDDVEIGDILGSPSEKLKGYKIPKTVFSASIEAKDEADKTKLVSVLTELSNQDPLLEFKKNPLNGELSVSLIGQIQREVLISLLEDNGIQVDIGHPEVIYMETPKGVGTAHFKYKKEQPYPAGIELKVEPLPRGSGIQFKSEVSIGYIVQPMQTALKESILHFAKEGLMGWEVTDCLVTFTDGYFNSVDSTPSSFRKLGPIVFMYALRNAGTILLEPRYDFVAIIEESDLGKVSYDLRNMAAEIKEQAFEGGTILIKGVVPIETSMNYRIELASQTRGKGVFETEFEGYFANDKGTVKTRERSLINPLNIGVYIRGV